MFNYDEDMMKSCKSAVVYVFPILKMNNSSTNIRLALLFCKLLISCLIIEQVVSNLIHPTFA